MVMQPSLKTRVRVTIEEEEVSSKIEEHYKSLLTVVWQSYEGGGNTWRSRVRCIPPQVCHNGDVECVFHKGLQVLESISCFCAWSDDLSLYVLIPWWKKTSRGLQRVGSLVLQWKMAKTKRSWCKHICWIYLAIKQWRVRMSVTVSW